MTETVVSSNRQDNREITVVEGLSVSYAGAGLPLLNDVSITLRSGEIFGLLGPNGAGKTTLIRAICRRVKPISGHLSVGGLIPGDKSYHRQIGLAPQDMALFSHMTARENLDAFGRMGGLRGAELRDRVSETMAAIQINDHLNTVVADLSGGWKRRVNIAAAVIHQPRLLILDEPTVGVDVRAQFAIEDSIRDYVAQGRAALITTHDMDQAERLCDRIGLLVNGRFIRTGPPQSLLKQHYGGQKLLSLRLASAPPDEIGNQLTKIGFYKAEPTLWTRLLVGTGEPEIASARAMDLTIREVSLSEPTLEHLMQDLAEPELAA